MDSAWIVHLSFLKTVRRQEDSHSRVGLRIDIIGGVARTVGAEHCRVERRPHDEPGQMVGRQG